MTQAVYDNWVSSTPAAIQLPLCFGGKVQESELSLINKYRPINILDIGCNTGERMFSEYKRQGICFKGIEKFEHLIQESPYKEHIVCGDIGDNDFFAKHQFDESIKFDCIALWAYVIIGFLDPNLRLTAWKNLAKLAAMYNAVLIVDTCSKFDWYMDAEKGQIIAQQSVPPQYFYARKELLQLFDNVGLTLIEEIEQGQHYNVLGASYFVLRANEKHP